MVNPNINKVNFNSRSKKELSKINSVSGKKSEGAKKRWFRHNNPDIDALMTFYRNNDQSAVMEKYITDNERFMDLFKNAIKDEDKRKILRDYQTFQLRIYELMFGSKTSMKVDANIDIKLTKYLEERNAKNQTSRLLIWKICEKEKEWEEKWGREKTKEMIAIVQHIGDCHESVVNENYENILKITKGEELPENPFGYKNVARIMDEIKAEEEAEKQKEIVIKSIPKKKKKQKEKEDEEEIYL